MDQIIAYCGLVCSECLGYIATQAGDQAALEELARRAAMEHGQEGLTAEDVRCDGCLAVAGPHCGYCAECAVRACGQARGVANCGRCSAYGDCETIQGFLAMVPTARAVLDAEQAQLGR